MVNRFRILGVNSIDLFVKQYVPKETNFPSDASGRRGLMLRSHFIVNSLTLSGVQSCGYRHCMMVDEIKSLNKGILLCSSRLDELEVYGDTWLFF
jgi:hypothetical protein